MTPFSVSVFPPEHSIKITGCGAQLEPHQGSEGLVPGSPAGRSGAGVDGPGDLQTTRNTQPECELHHQLQGLGSALKISS